MTICPYAKSDMTPCVRKDGDVCYAMNARDNPVCVGCGRTPEQLRRQPPLDWGSTIAAYYRTHPKARRF